MAPAPNVAFNEWATKWIDLATFTRKRLPDEVVDERIEKISKLWGESIPPGWEREKDLRLLNRELRYGRGTNRVDHVPRGEYIIECDILKPSPMDVTTVCLDSTLVDGVNALPLTRDAGGGREGNVEADMLLLVKNEHSYGLQLIEVKVEADNPWYAAVENLRQLRLFSESREAQRLFHTRCSAPDLPEELHVTGVVLAPHDFYKARGQKANAVAPARRLLEQMGDEVHVDVCLATWDPSERVIEPL